MVINNILVIGGAGYLGARISLFLSEKGYQVTALCRNDNNLTETWKAKIHKLIIGDITDNNLLNKIEHYQFDVVVYLISLDQKNSNKAPAFVSNINITPVWSLLDMFSRKDLKKFIYLSTSQVYGELKTGMIFENKLLEPNNSYALTHQIGELFCDYYNRNSGIKCTAVRLTNSYGSPILPNENSWNLVINDLCKSAFVKNEIVLLSDGSPSRDFIHGWDVCLAISKIIDNENFEPVINLSSGETYSILDIAYKIKETFLIRYNLNIPILTSKNTSNTKSKKYYIKNTKLNLIGFTPHWTLEKGINEIFDYLETSNFKTN